MAVVRLCPVNQISKDTNQSSEDLKAHDTVILAVEATSTRPMYCPIPWECILLRFILEELPGLLGEFWEYCDLEALGLDKVLPLVMVDKVYI